MIVDVACVVPGIAVTLNIAVVAPAGTVTLTGTVAADVLLLLRVTTAPPAGAGPAKVTVPVEEMPPITTDGFNVTEATPAGFTVTTAIANTVVAPLEISAKMVTCVGWFTGEVVTVKVPLPVTKTLAGTLATDGLSLLRWTVVVLPALETITLPSAGLPPVT